MWGGCVRYSVYAHYVKEQELASVYFENYLYAAQDASTILRLLDEKRFDTIRKVEWTNLESAIDGSNRIMVSHEPELGFMAPNLVLGLVETEEYLAAGDPQSRLNLWLRDVTNHVRKVSAENEQDAITQLNLSVTSLACARAAPAG